MVTDPISDFIVRLKNGSDAGLPVVALPYSALKHSIASALEKGGFVDKVEKTGKGVETTLSVTLRYVGSEPRVHGVDRISKPSRRMYQKARDIRVFKSGYGAVVYSTPKGIMLDVDAKKNKVGGEILFKIW